MLPDVFPRSLLYGLRTYSTYSMRSLPLRVVLPFLNGSVLYKKFSSFPIASSVTQGRRYDGCSSYSMSPCSYPNPLPVQYFSWRVGAHFPAYAFCFSSHCMPTPIQSSIGCIVWKFAPLSLFLGCVRSSGLIATHHSAHSS